MQYLLGLKQLGFDVYYLEDCGEESWVYNWDTESLTTEIDYPARYVRDCLEPIGFQNRWMYRAGERAAGLSIRDFCQLCAEAALLVIWGDPILDWRPEYDLPKRRAFIDVDPGFTQIALSQGDRDLCNTVDRCERIFTIGQRFGLADCPIPTVDKQWLTIRPPVSLPHWPRNSVADAAPFTTVMDWRGFRDAELDGVTYGQKDKVFPKFMDLPAQTIQPLLVAHLGGDSEELRRHGWEEMPGWIPSETPWSYRQFIQESRAEFSIAKELYVETRGGWFSDRSVCYLASGKPVLVQDTGLSDWLPTGQGIVTFRDLPEAVKGIDEINADYEKHCRIARELAEEYFSADQILPSFVECCLT